MRSKPLGVLLWALLATCAVRADSGFQVTDAWIRWLPANVPAGGYMTLVNTGVVTDRLIGADSPDYGEISFHQTRSHGLNEMVAVAALELKPNVPVRFEVGGYHLMLMQPQRAVKPGDRVLVTLRFAVGQPMVVPFAVRAGNEQ
jgi:copper(I)-binding protein